MNNQNTETIIFGYGSLINLESLKTTAPNAYNIKPAYIKGFRREFCVLDSVGWTETNLDVSGQPMCAVDVHEVNDPNGVVNGLVFSVSRADLQKLVAREGNYELINTPYYDFKTDEKLGECSVFSAGKHNGSYDFKGAAQARYLQI
jgi:cation transport regulator ChaC